jgi:hypothetical protein
MDPRLGEIATRQFPAQQRHGHHGPGRVKAFPMTKVVQRRAEMVSQRHALFLLFPHLKEEITRFGARSSPAAPNG